MWARVFHGEGVVASVGIFFSFCTGASKCRRLINRGHAAAAPLSRLAAISSPPAGGFGPSPVRDVCQMPQCRHRFSWKLTKKRKRKKRRLRLPHPFNTRTVTHGRACTHTLMRHRQIDGWIDTWMDGGEQTPRGEWPPLEPGVLSVGAADRCPGVLLWWRAASFWQVQLLQFSGQSWL